MSTRRLAVRALSVPVLVLGAACYAPAANVAAEPTSRSVDDAYDCAMRAVNDLQYTVTNTERASGFIQAQRAQTGGLYVDRLSISAFRDDAGTTALRVVPEVVSATEMFPASRAGVKAQRAVVQRCTAAVPGDHS